MKRVLIITFLISGISIFSQENFNKHFTLQWEKQNISPPGVPAVFVASVKGQGVDIVKKIPVFTARWKTRGKKKILDYVIDKVEYKPVESNLLGATDTRNLRPNPQIQFWANSTRNENHVYCRLIPMVKRNGKVFKITSFDVRFTLKDAKPVKSTHDVTQSVLSSGQWYKFSVDTTGVYKIDRNFLSDLGVDVNNTDPRKIAIYGNGGSMLPFVIGDDRYPDLQENTIFVHGEQDGQFDSGDYILFYAQGPDDWVHDGTRESIRHRKNPFSSKSYYFIHIKENNALRIQDAPAYNNSPEHTLTTYDAYALHEKDITTLSHMGRQWVGENFNLENERDFLIHFNSVDTGASLRVRTRVAHNNKLTSSTMNVKLNGTPLYNISLPISFSETYEGRTGEHETSTNVSSGELSFHLTFTSSPTAKGYLDYIEVTGMKHLKGTGKSFSFRNFDASSYSYVKYEMQNASNYDIWDVTDHLHPVKVQKNTNSGTLNFTYPGGLKEFIAVRSGNYLTPDIPENPIVENQNLHGLQNVDYLIITRNDFVEEAERLADFHRQHDNLNVKVVPLYRIYNEFASGSTDVTAIRDFIRHVYLHSAPHTRYVLMLGDTSNDYRQLEEMGEFIVPSFEYRESYNKSTAMVTDDFFAVVSDETEGDLENYTYMQTMDLAIGRMPARSLTEVQAMIDKAIHYYDIPSKGDWKNRVCFAIDDADEGWENGFFTTIDDIAGQVKQNKPVLNILKLYADAFPQQTVAGGSRYPDFNRKFNENMDKGMLLMNYFGHGGEDGLAQERIMETDQIRNWNNYNRLSTFLIISCEFARFDNPARPNTAGELCMRNPHGATAHMIATARAMGAFAGESLNYKIIPYLLEFDGAKRSISESLRLAKNEQLNNGQRAFVFSFGDPAMPLALPRPNVKLTHMNDVSVTQALDTIKGLSHISFKGIITDEDDNPLNDYNGILQVSIYDKSYIKNTLGNDPAAQIFPFEVQESTIYRGQASVESGQFNFDFVAPKDIRQAYGPGKLSFYVYNDSTDKNGYNKDIIIGGIDENAPDDTTGPEIRLFINDPSFTDGGNTNQSPLLLVELEDEHGINTSTTAVDHDIVAYLDGDTSNPYVLNDYYITEPDNYKKGKVQYYFYNLDPGEHQILLKAYDTYNNKSEATIHFKVLDDNSISLEHVLNYPNPFIDYTEFWFSHNKPGTNLNVQIQIFTISGKLVKTINRQIFTEGTISREITWDGRDDFGQKIGKGVYIYRILIEDPELGIKTDKYEKLVILQ